MIRKEFVEYVTHAGMMTYKEIRPLLNDKDPNSIPEFDLLKYKNFDELKFAQYVSEKASIPFLDLENARVSKETMDLMSRSDVIKFRAIPVQRTSSSVTLAIFDPTIANMAQELSALIKMPVELIITNISSWKKLYGTIEQSVDELLDHIHEVKTSDLGEEDIKEEDISDDIITFVNKILAQAFLKKASDIHIEPYEKTFRIRFRMDGTLIEVSTPPMSLMLPMISRVKIMAQMDISERRKPQDGRIKLKVGPDVIDYRVSSLPTLFGEKIVLRLLDKSSLNVDMTKLGFEQKQLDNFKEAIYKPFGMCLVTGPTGSGKTTTLYSAIVELNKVDCNISTAEDPVEYNLEGINQVNVRKEIDLTFARALKAFLRQDPDIVMVGEIRDLETGEIAIEASLTGHMVLSTLHTNDASSTITRLINMGVEPFLIAASLNVVVAQRLCRKICEKCKVLDSEVTPEFLAKCGLGPKSASTIKVYKGEGCDNCNHLGYKGRVAVYEVLPISVTIRDMILGEKSSDEIKLAAVKEGMKTLRMSALTKVALGQTTIEEAVAKTGSDDF